MFKMHSPVAFSPRKVELFVKLINYRNKLPLVYYLLPAQGEFVFMCCNNTFRYMIS